MNRMPARRGFLIAIAAPFLLGQMPASQRQLRRIEGTVRDENGSPLNFAVVQLKNTSTLMVRSYRTRRDGAYRFSRTDSSVDYDLSAEYRGVRSAVKTVSKFDGRPVVVVDLVISLGPQSAGGYVEGRLAA
jgi:carboxypeptidase family protein